MSLDDLERAERAERAILSFTQQVFPVEYEKLGLAPPTVPRRMYRLDPELMDGLIRIGECCQKQPFLKT